MRLGGNILVRSQQVYHAQIHRERILQMRYVLTIKIDIPANDDVEARIMAKDGVDKISSISHWYTKTECKLQKVYKDREPVGMRMK